MPSSQHRKAVIDALKELGRLHTPDELLDYRTAVAGVLDAGLGDIAEVDLVLLAHRNGIARAVADVRQKKLPVREVERLTKYAAKQLFGVSEEAALYVVTAWAGAFKKTVPQRNEPNLKKPVAAKPQPRANQTPPKPVTRSYSWWAFSKALSVVAAFATLIASAIVFSRALNELPETFSSNQSPSEAPATESELVQPQVSLPAVEAQEEVAAVLPKAALPNSHASSSEPIEQTVSVQVRTQDRRESWERLQERSRRREQQAEQLAALRKRHNVPPPPDGWEWRYYPTDPRWKSLGRSSYPYGALPPQRPRNN